VSAVSREWEFREAARRIGALNGADLFRNLFGMSGELAKTFGERTPDTLGTV
jgi:hypothetical protein